MSRQRRRFFRLRLPLNDRIPARIDGHRYLIRELSEGGMRVAPANSHVAALAVGERVTAELMFHDGSRLTIEGTIARRDAEEWVIVGVAGISFARMLSRATAAGKEIPPNPLIAGTPLSFAADVYWRDYSPAGLANCGLGLGVGGDRGPLQSQQSAPRLSPANPSPKLLLMPSLVNRGARASLAPDSPTKDGMDACINHDAQKDNGCQLARADTVGASAGVGSCVCWMQPSPLSPASGYRGLSTDPGKEKQSPLDAATNEH